MQHGLAAANVARQNARKLATEHELAAARIDLDGLKIRELVLEQIRDKIVIAEERVASAEAGIERSLVRAPADGRIVEYLCTLGSDVRRGETLLAVQPDKEVWLEAWATGKEAKDLHVGDEVDIELATDPVQVLVGRIEAVTEDADFGLNAQQTKLLRLLGGNRTPTCVLRISLPEGQAGLMPGVGAVVQKRGSSAPGTETTKNSTQRNRLSNAAGYGRETSKQTISLLSRK
ncbi:MAG: hypothetical protein CMJ64_01820 [Planctomycetaceae bacterium]|nr:hypothetical protein [Planctomycetaceae bacterium]